ncbi:MAG TPA: ribonuclease T2 [Pseudolabrys sp.]|nr:ribonuclease T2 [Pseudolabrys sp.]
MTGRRIRQVTQTAAVTVSLILICAVAALAQEHRRGTPGNFDFYVLALSWSPSYCEASRDRAPNRPPGRQCAGRPFSFVVHGLWPQYERGFPSYCQVPAPRLNRKIVGSMLDLMPSPRLIFHEWDRHGTCSGLSPHTYFETVRKARAAVKIPADYLELDKPTIVSPSEVAAAFVKANPGLSSAGVAVSCDGKRLTEVRVCLAKDFSFHDCVEISRRACRVDKIAMPAVRGG